jgi:hypothetical protein
MNFDNQRIFFIKVPLKSVLCHVGLARAGKMIMAAEDWHPWLIESIGMGQTWLPQLNQKSLCPGTSWFINPINYKLYMCDSLWYVLIFTNIVAVCYSMVFTIINQLSRSLAVLKADFCPRGSRALRAVVCYKLGGQLSFFPKPWDRW